MIHNLQFYFFRVWRAILRLMANHCIVPCLRPLLFGLSGVVVGKNVTINMGFTVVDNYNGGMIILEEGVAIAPNVTLVATSGPNKSFIGEIYDLIKEGKITIKRGAWLGSNITVLPGITIGEGAIIGAGAVIVEDVPDYAIMVGPRAKQIGDVRNKPVQQHN